MRVLSGLDDRPIRWIVDDASKFTAREVRRGRRYDGILLDPPKFGRGPEGEVWRLEENLAPLLADCRRLLDEDSRFLVLTVYAVRMSALAIGELVRQTFGDLGGTVEMGEMAVREEARGLLLPTAIFARWSDRSGEPGSRRRRRTARRRSAAAKPPLPEHAERIARAAPKISSGTASGSSSRPASEPARGRPAVTRRDRDRQRGEAGRADRQRDLGPRERRAVHRQQRRAGHRGDQQQRREGQPVRGDLGRRRCFPRRRREARAGRARRRRGRARSAARSAAAPRSARRSTSAPGPIRASSRASGPTANGISAATSRKKATGSQAAPVEAAPQRRGR